MRKFYKKISWIVNGLMLGVIVAGLVDRSFRTMVIGALISLAIVAAFKGIGWLRRRRSEW